jgi:two-component system, NarL family, invasion response regulator UvrY
MKRILVVDDHQIVRAGLKQLLSGYDGFAVEGEAATGAAALELVQKSDWSLVLLDISMPDANGIDTLKRIKDKKPKLPVLIFTMHPEENYAINLIRAGANGYICKDSTPEQLIAAIRTVTSGRRYISPALGEQLASSLGGDCQSAPHTLLSEREFQIFCKLAAGQPVSQVATDLFLSVKTVSTYRARILETMRIKTNAKLMYYAIKHGLV